jgi:type I restriction enzyme S subunit
VTREIMMKYGLSKATIEKIRAVFARFPAVEKAVLYGSRAKGNFKDGSDIDLTLYGEALTADVCSAIASELDDLPLPYTIDLSIFEELNHAKLRDHIERVGVVFYEREGAGNQQAAPESSRREAAMKKGWQTKNLGDVCDVVGGGTPPKDNPAFYSGHIPWATVRDMRQDVITETEFRITKDAVKSSATNIIPSRNVVIATRVGLGKVCILAQDTAINQDLRGIVPRGGKTLEVRFLYWWLKSIADVIVAEGTGATVQGVKLPFVKSLPIPVPPLPEQQRIVGILDAAFAGIATAKANAEKNLHNARALFDSHLQTVFSQRGMGWVEKRLTEISQEFGRGKSRHRPRNEPKLYNGPYPFIQTGDISNADHWLTDYTQTYSELGLAQSRLWQKGTICIAIVGATVGETAILDFEACFPDSVIGIVVNNQFADNEYVEYLLQSFKALLKEKGKGTARDNINLGTFENQRFPFPSLKYQKGIVTTLNSLHAETQRLAVIYQCKLAALEALKKSLLHQAFTGEL